MHTQAIQGSEISSQEARAFVLTSIALASGIFGIAFWYGVFGTVFFEQIFYVWVAATVALIASLFVPPHDALPAFLSWKGRFVLALPTIWMLMLAAGYEKSESLAHAGWLEWALTLSIVALTLPYLVYVLILVAIPDIESLKHPRLRSSVFVIALAIAVAGYAIGKNHPQFVTCYDFKVSGSNVPENCQKAAGG